MKSNSNKTRKLPPSVLFIALSVGAASAQTTWWVNNVTNIGGHAVTVLGTNEFMRLPVPDR